MGEQYPAASTIAERCGGWLGALATADRFRRLGGMARISVSAHLDLKKALAAQRVLRETGRARGYQPEHIQQALTACKNFLGDWPYRGEFYLWAKLARNAA